jgi:hypothetical protein
MALNLQIEQLQEVVAEHFNCHPTAAIYLSCNFGIFTASMAFTVLTAARLPLLPPSRAGPLTTLQAALNHPGTVL